MRTTQQVALVAVIIGVGSCQEPSRNRNLGVGLDFGLRAIDDGIRKACITRAGIVLIALEMCHRDEEELLGATGETFEFGGGFACGAILQSGDARGYRFVGVAEARGQTAAEDVVLLPSIHGKDMVDVCEKLKVDLSALSLGATEREENLVIYLSCRLPPSGTLIRLSFVGRITPNGTIRIRCDSASAVEATHVRFVRSPDTGE